MAESAIVKQILRYLKALPCCFCWKEHGGLYGTAGIPDIICCVHGRFVAFEVKVPGGTPTKLQEITMQRINEAKGIACKVTSVQEVQAVIRQLSQQEGLPIETRDHDGQGVSGPGVPH